VAPGRGGGRGRFGAGAGVWAQAPFNGSPPDALAALRSSISPLKQQAVALAKDVADSLARVATARLESLRATMTARIPEDYSWLLAAKAERNEALLEEKVWSRASEYENLWTSIKPVTRTLSTVRELEKNFPPGVWAASLAPLVADCQARVRDAQTFATALCLVNIAANKLRIAAKSPAAARNVVEMITFVQRHGLQSLAPAHLWEEVQEGARAAGLTVPGNPPA
jgi:hypothetical protein